MDGLLEKILSSNQISPKKFDKILCEVLFQNEQNAIEPYPIEVIPGDSELQSIVILFKCPRDICEHLVKIQNKVSKRKSIPKEEDITSQEKSDPNNDVDTSNKGDEIDEHTSNKSVKIDKTDPDGKTDSNQQRVELEAKVSSKDESTPKLNLKKMPEEPPKDGKKKKGKFAFGKLKKVAKDNTPKTVAQKISDSTETAGDNTEGSEACNVNKTPAESVTTKETSDETDTPKETPDKTDIPEETPNKTDESKEAAVEVNDREHDKLKVEDDKTSKKAPGQHADSHTEDMDDKSSNGNTELLKDGQEEKDVIESVLEKHNSEISSNIEEHPEEITGREKSVKIENDTKDKIENKNLLDENTNDAATKDNGVAYPDDEINMEEKRAEKSVRYEVNDNERENRNDDDDRFNETGNRHNETGDCYSDIVENYNDNGDRRNDNGDRHNDNGDHYNNNDDHYNEDCERIKQNNFGGRFEKSDDMDSKYIPFNEEQRKYIDAGKTSLAKKCRRRQMRKIASQDVEDIDTFEIIRRMREKTRRIVDRQTMMMKHKF